MTIGTKSILFGAHQFLLHPFFVAWAWWRLFGFPRDPRLWIAFVVHDLGYWGKPNMDGAEGELHPQLGHDLMAIFGRNWAVFTAGHSRFFAERARMPRSQLCVADKLAFVLTPAWLYLPLANASGEIHEYMAHAAEGVGGKYRHEYHSLVDQRAWVASVKRYLTDWVAQEQQLWQ